MSHAPDGLAPDLLERVLQRLGFADRPPPTLDGLTALYAAWCEAVPFDNLRKLIWLRRGIPGPLPGSHADDFFEAWLRDGTGSTCWGGHTAMHALLTSLGFSAVRGYATMLIAPDIPPNHGTVVVDLDGRRYLVDASILHGRPLQLIPGSVTETGHPSWGARATPHGDLHLIRFQPVHTAQPIDCRIDRIDVGPQVFLDLHEGTRGWSPFNWQLYARVNRGDTVVGTGFGQVVRIDAQGRIGQQPLDPEDRLRFLVEEIGIREELAAQVPADQPTPPPPGSATARAAA